MKLPIVTHPNPVLRAHSTEIAEATDEIKTLAYNMIETMVAAQGVGLAAPQVGKTIRLIIVGDKAQLPMINPVITARSFRKDVMEEGCLSIPGVSVAVKRSTGITVQYTNLDGERISLKQKGFLARVIQHEVDHLDGILIIDKVTSE